MTIAQEWQDFREHAYGRQPIEPEMEREYRLIFFAGFRACQLYFAAMSKSGMSSDEMQRDVQERFEEFDAYAKEYLAERQRDQ